NGLIDLYEASFERRWLVAAEEIADAMVERFHDEAEGGFFTTEGNDPSVLLRLKDDYDGAEPSGNSIAALALVRLANAIDRTDFARAAHGRFGCFSARLKEAPHALPQMIVAFALDWEPPVQIVIAAEKDDAGVPPLARVVHEHFVPSKILLLADDESRAA